MRACDLGDDIDERASRIGREAFRNAGVVVPEPRGRLRHALPASGRWRQEQEQECLLSVEPVFGLVEHDRRG